MHSLEVKLALSIVVVCYEQITQELQVNHRFGRLECPSSSLDRGQLALICQAKFHHVMQEKERRSNVSVQMGQPRQAVTFFSALHRQLVDLFPTDGAHELVLDLDQGERLIGASNVEALVVGVVWQESRALPAKGRPTIADHVVAAGAFLHRQLAGRAVFDAGDERRRATDP